VAEPNVRSFEVSSTFVMGNRIHYGPMASLYRGTWGRYSQPVHFRTYEKLSELGLLPTDTGTIRTSLLQARPPRGKNLPDIYDQFTDPDLHVVTAMKLPEGQTLQDRLRSQGALSLERTVQVIQGVANALRTCRSHGPAHRGPTADRIWLGQDNEVFLMGYGEVLYYAVMLSPRVQMHPQLIWHVPPEVFRATSTGKQVSSVARAARARLGTDHQFEESPRAEVFALACLAHHCLSGSHPFFWEPTDASAGMEGMLAEASPPLEALPPEHPAAQIIARGMSFDPAARHETPWDFAQDLHAAVLNLTEPVTWTVPTGRDADEEAADESSDRFSLGTPAVSVDADDVVDAPEERERLDPASIGFERTMLRVTSVVLLLGLVGTALFNLSRPTSIVITSGSHIVGVAEVVGHTNNLLGTTPLVVPRDNLLDPWTLRMMGSQGEEGSAYTFQPAQFQDLGRCRRLDLAIIEK
jgi:serine/threonine protein kinase